MIVSCENCHTRFKIDEKRLIPAGVKLRCSRCQHTFELKPLAPTVAEPSAASSPPAPGEAQSAPLIAPPEGEGESARSVADVAPAVEPGVPEEVIYGAAPGSALSGPLDPDEVDHVVEEALRSPEGPAAGDMNQAEGGERSGRADDLFGAPNDDDPDGSTQDLSPPLGAGAGEPRDRSEDFDWDHVSFTEDPPAAADDSARGSEEANARSESEPLELDIKRPAMKLGRDASPRDVHSALPESAGSGETGLELDRPAAAPLARAAESTPRSFSAEEENDHEKRPEAPLRGTKPSVFFPGVARSLPSPSVAWPKRPPLVLPLVPTLAGSILLGLFVAVVSAFTLYAPAGPRSRIASTVHPQGTGLASSALRLDDISGRRVRREDAIPLYVVTGKARWSAPPKGVWFLEGVLVDRNGRALQRRSAQVGPLSALSHLLASDPARLTQHTPLPPRGESGFLILFTPEPSWQADVRFEVRLAD